MQALLLLISLGLAWVPLTILLVSAVHSVSARWLWRVFGIPSLALLALIWLYSWQIGLPLASLIGWGVVSGIALTVALDIVRLAGVRLGTMPMDMPMNFGLRATDLIDEVKKKMMERMKAVGAMGMPTGLTMFGAAAMMKPIIAEVMEEKKAKGEVMMTGYIWHFLNGITFGLCYTLGVGSGHWLIALGWGLLVWVLMMLVMPALMNGAKITASIFFTALIAHVVMALPLIWIPQAALSETANQFTLLSLLAKLVGV